MKVLFCASEMSPFAKTGGLADVAGALPLALENLGVEIKAAVPRYKIFDNYSSSLKRLSPDIESLKIGSNIEIYLIRNDKYFNRDNFYGDNESDYPDNLERFAFFCGRILSLLKEFDIFHPANASARGGCPDIIHCNDWQTGLIPVYLKSLYKGDDFYAGIKTIFTIHNLAYQGVFDKKEYPKLGLGPSLFSTNGLEFYDKINLLKGAIIFSDILNTVSPSYAREIQTRELGCGLEGALDERSNDLYGVLNGLDYEYWNPEDDKFIQSHYSSKNIENKYANKKALLDELRLSDAPGAPLFAMVGRLVMQKGLDILIKAIDGLIREFDLRIIILGRGRNNYERLLSSLEKRYPENIRMRNEFDEPLAHRIYAGCDVFLMPSYYEPCGLGQMIALRYAAIPLVFRTGGLSDTISEENGFVFDSYTAQSFTGAVKRAISTYQDKRKWRGLINNSSAYDFSWSRSAKKYLDLYRKLIP